MWYLENWQNILQNYRKVVFREVTHGLFTFSFLSLKAVHELHGRRVTVNNTSKKSSNKKCSGAPGLQIWLYWLLRSKTSSVSYGQFSVFFSGTWKKFWFKNRFSKELREISVLSKKSSNKKCSWAPGLQRLLYWLLRLEASSVSYDQFSVFFFGTWKKFWFKNRFSKELREISFVSKKYSNKKCSAAPGLQRLLYWLLRSEASSVSYGQFSVFFLELRKFWFQKRFSP